MRKFFLFTFFVLIGLTVSAQKTRFKFIYQFGVEHKNEINTFDNTYTHDMVLDPPLTVPFHLKKRDIAQILAKMKEIGLFDYPSNFMVTVPDGQNFCQQTPYSTYYYRVELNGKTTEVRWPDNICNKDPKADKLRDLNRFIEMIIKSKAAYRNLPKPRGGYQ